MLFAVSDYCRDRDDPSQLLSPDEVSLLVGGQEPQLKKLDLFKQLVDEGYINAELMEAWKGGASILCRSYRGPHEKWKPTYIRNVERPRRSSRTARWDHSSVRPPGATKEKKR